MTPDEFQEKAAMMLDLIDEVKEEIANLKKHANDVYRAINREQYTAKENIDKERNFTETWTKRMRDDASKQFDFFQKDVLKHKLTMNLLGMGAVVGVVSGMVSGYAVILVLKHWQHIFF